MRGRKMLVGILAIVDAVVMASAAYANGGTLGGTAAM